MKKIIGCINSNEIDEMLVEDIIFKMWPLILFLRKIMKLRFSLLKNLKKMF